MKLIHKSNGQEARVGDIVFDSAEIPHRLEFFREPHKPSSEGKCCVKALRAPLGTGLVLLEQYAREYYVGVFKLEWIDREDRKEWKDEAND